MYIFLLTESGARTNICSTIKLVNLEQLIKYLEEDKKIKEKRKEYNYYSEYYKKLNIKPYCAIRVGKVNDHTFQTRILKYITLEEFENIFKGNIDKIQPLLEYRDVQSALFKKEILKKYGKKIEEE